LVPALAFAMTLVLALGLLYGLQGGGSLPTPGAAVGAPLWVVVEGAVLVLALLAAVLVIWCRR
jgi:hypothetical protein